MFYVQLGYYNVIQCERNHSMRTEFWCTVVGVMLVHRNSRGNWSFVPRPFSPDTQSSITAVNTRVAQYTRLHLIQLRRRNAVVISLLCVHIIIIIVTMIVRKPLGNIDVEVCARYFRRGVPSPRTFDWRRLNRTFFQIFNSMNRKIVDCKIGNFN